LPTAGNRRTKIQVLSLAKDAYAMKTELLTNATVVDDAIRFVAANTNNKELTVRTKATGNYEAEIDQENNMQTFNEMSDDLEESHQEVDNDPSTQTTNQVFQGLLNCDTHCVNPSCLNIPSWS
jgi:hypothetical protein